MLIKYYNQNYYVSLGEMLIWKLIWSVLFWDVTVKINLSSLDKLKYVLI